MKIRAKRLQIMAFRVEPEGYNDRHITPTIMIQSTSYLKEDPRIIPYRGFAIQWWHWYASIGILGRQKR